MLALSGCLGCSTSSDYKDEVPGSGFELVDAFDLGRVDASIELSEVAYPSGPPVQAASDDEFHTVFEPGALPWVKPGHRVVFHHVSKFDEPGDVHFGPERMLFDALDHEPPALFEPLSYAHGISLTSLWDAHHKEDLLIQPVRPRVALLEGERPVTVHYVGFYLPEVIRTDTSFAPTLHLVACHDGPGRPLFLIGGIYMGCSMFYRAEIYMPEPQEDFLCRVRAQFNEMNAFYGHDFEFPLPVSCEDDALKTMYPTQIETVTWIGYQPPRHEAHEHGYSYMSSLQGYPEKLWIDLCGVDSGFQDREACRSRKNEREAWHMWLHYRPLHSNRLDYNRVWQRHEDLLSTP